MWRSYIIHNADYIISFGPFRSVRIFRVIKIVRLGQSSKQCFNDLIPFRRLDIPCVKFEIAVYLHVSGYRRQFIKGH